MKDFLDEKFDLQLFAEDDGATPEDTVNESVENTPDESDEFEFYIDDNGNFRTKDGSEEVADETEEDETPADQQEQPEPEDTHAAEPSKYKVKVAGEELEVSLDELLQGYMRTSDYTRKTQEVARLRQEAEQAKSTQPKVEQAQPTQPVVDKVSIAKQLSEEAKAVVKATTGEDYDPWNDEHQAIYNVELQQKILATQLEQRRTEDKVNSYQNLINDYKMKEPNFEQIDIYAQERLLSLPAKDYFRITEAVNRGDVETIRTFIDETRTEWYKKETGVVNTPKDNTPAKQKTEPPKVENAGNGDLKTQPKNRNINDFRGGSFDDKVEMLKKWGLV